MTVPARPPAVQDDPSARPARGATLPVVTGGAYRLGTADPVMIIELSVTSWCNYSCAYCVTTVQARRDDALHAFDRHDVGAWIAAFERVPFDFSLLCRGGEPFLDHQGFSRFLAGIGALPRLRYTRVDTNGSWSPDRYEGVPREVRERVRLNVSFHPTQIDLDVFARRLGRILDAGWDVAMVNYVMQADQADGYEQARAVLGERYGVYVNPNPDAFDPAPEHRGLARRDARPDRLRSLLPVVDHARKTGALTVGKPCFFPSIGYFVAPDGVAERACGVAVAGAPRRLDFIRDSARLEPLPRPVACPQLTCLCLDRYAFLEEVPGRGRALDLLDEYVTDCRAAQGAVSR